jgi:GxxExxY protein
LNHRGTENTEKRRSLNHRGTAITERTQKKKEKVMVEERDPVTQGVIGAAIEVHRIMGPGLLESVYQKCLERELKLRGMSFISQSRLPLLYKGEALGDDLIMDFYLPSVLVVELKAVEKLIPIHDAQLLTYLRLSRTPVGLLINFNVPLLKDGIKRLVI